MVEKEDRLGLSLSLRCLDNNQDSNPSTVAAAPPTAAAAPFPLNLFGCPLPFSQQHKLFVDRNAAEETRPLSRVVDVNRALTLTDCEEEIMVSSPNSTLSSLSAKRSSEREENDSSSLEIDDDGGEGAARKKLRLCKEQAAVLEETFKDHSTLNPKQKLALAKKLNLRPRQVEVWFQNRRARTKLKQTEVDCEYLKRCFENLTNENTRLQKEVIELRALKRSPQFHMNMSPPTTLTMCPQCERLAVSSPSSAANTTTATTGRQAHHQQQRPMSMTSWAGIITQQPPDVHRPKS